ncbi:MAG: hypothetical protein WC284_06375 [Candidimonas sp.]
MHDLNNLKNLPWRTASLRGMEVAELTDDVAAVEAKVGDMSVILTIHGDLIAFSDRYGSEPFYVDLANADHVGIYWHVRERLNQYKDVLVTEMTAAIFGSAEVEDFVIGSRVSFGSFEVMTGTVVNNFNYDAIVGDDGVLNECDETVKVIPDTLMVFFQVDDCEAEQISFGRCVVRLYHLGHSEDVDVLVECLGNGEIFSFEAGGHCYRIKNSHRFTTA